MYFYINIIKLGFYVNIIKLNITLKRKMFLFIFLNTCIIRNHIINYFYFIVIVYKKAMLKTKNVFCK